VLPGVRTDPVGTATTLDQYRRKYQTYRTDPDLQAAHAKCPIVPIWDDHEVANNYDRTVDPARRSAAYQAWFEHMPVFPVDGQADRIYRNFGWGGLADLFMLDTRQYRDPVPASKDTSTAPGSSTNDLNRTILGMPQRSWLENGMARVVGTLARGRQPGDDLAVARSGSRQLVHAPRRPRPAPERRRLPEHGLVGRLQRRAHRSAAASSERRQAQQPLPDR
jgi:hypothetical protein